MKEITRLFEIDIPAQERIDALYLDDETLSFRSKNSGDIVMNTYNSYYCEAVYSLNKENTLKFLDSLQASWNSIGDIVEKKFRSPAGLDQLKRHCDRNNIQYHYEFIID